MNAWSGVPKARSAGSAAAVNRWTHRNCNAAAFELIDRLPRPAPAGTKQSGTWLATACVARGDSGVTRSIRASGQDGFPPVLGTRSVRALGAKQQENPRSVAALSPRTLRTFPTRKPSQMYRLTLRAQASPLRNERIQQPFAISTHSLEVTKESLAVYRLWLH